MAECDWGDILIVEDETQNLEIMRSIVESEKRDHAFYIADIGWVFKKHRDWREKMPRVVPHFAVKCNPDPVVIKVLAALGACFDCASQQEIQKVMAVGVAADRIIFANPAKVLSDLSYARKVGVERMTVDSKEEITKIQRIFPSAKLLIRIRNDGLIDQGAMTLLGEKFGCSAEIEAPELMNLIKKIGMSLVGFSFHAGSPCPDNEAYSAGIKTCKKLIDLGRSIGMKEICIIDIGGGFLGNTDEVVDGYAKAINAALEDVDPSIKIISEPGRYYVESAFTLGAMVHSKKLLTVGNTKRQNLYIDDGCYGSFIEELLALKARLPVNLYKVGSSSEDELIPSKIWGPTCDSHDCVIKNAMLPNFSIGDWMVWSDMGAYTISLCCSFNGIPPPDVYRFIRRSAMKALQDAVQEAQESSFKNKNGVCYEKSLKNSL